ncbi:hypothetical protein [Streptomyces corynorhini]|uniref:hypothetical protein n=1 Tax=Streptomyces corynorhini TaxID=2282652 RepID=UPI001F250A58|nr:hypothetical protein [Streptomyces corynorhini]
MSMNATLVLVGVDIPGSRLLREGRHDPAGGQWQLPPSQHANAYGLEATQAERHFDLIEPDRFHYNTAPQITAWIDHLHGIEENLRLLNARPDMLTEGGMPEYLFDRTNGVIGLLERLIEDGCREAIDSGEEQLTENLLKNVTIDLHDTGRRDADAGEVPAVPNKPASRPRRRGRNTVLDDRGPLGTAMAGAR